MPQVLRPLRYAASSPGSVRCQRSEWHRRRRVPVGLEARGEHESPTVIEDHQPRVPQTGLLYVLRVGVAQHLAEAATAARASSS